MKNYWQTAKRKIPVGDKTLVMAILNRTPESFSDGGRFFSIDGAVEQAENLIVAGADILDIGGESTRPHSVRVSAEEEIRRVVPLVEAVAKRFDVPISIDTSKAEVAAAAIDSGAEIVNDISGLRFNERIADVAARAGAALVLMHSRGDFETMHAQSPIENIFDEVASDFRRSVETARKRGIAKENIALDVGIGFSKTFDNNLVLLAKLNALVRESAAFPMLVGASRKSFVGKILGGAPAGDRINGSLAAAPIAVWNGANIIRVHDVEATIEAIKVVDAIKKHL